MYETCKKSSCSERGLQISDLNLDRCLLNLQSSKDGAANKQEVQPSNKAMESAQKAADMAHMTSLVNVMKESRKKLRV